MLVHLVAVEDAMEEPGLPRAALNFERAKAAGVLLSQGTRVGTGRTVRNPGLRRRGWFALDDLPARKAWILLRPGRARKFDPDEIRGHSDTY